MFWDKSFAMGSAIS